MYEFLRMNTKMEIAVSNFHLSTAFFFPTELVILKPQSAMCILSLKLRNMM
jgi:hypothetical protein